MSWVSDYKYTWSESLALNILKWGPCLPRHIAFIMDGNRRYARSEQLVEIEGHSRGFNKLADCLRWCLDIGIQEVTTFAFSIENFKRSSEEVNDLLNLARDKFDKLIKETQKLNEHGVRIRVIGNIDLLPDDLQNRIAFAVLNTEQNDKLFLNIAFSYTSRDEITQSVEAILKFGDCLVFNDINERLLEDCLYTGHSSSPDLIFRTSGETRLSDFMMWQLTSSELYFLEVLWPQITIWNFFSGILTHQRARHNCQKLQHRENLKNAKSVKTSLLYSGRVRDFLLGLDIYRKEFLTRISSK